MGGGAGAQWSIKSILAKKLKKIFLTKMVQFNSAHKINLLGMFYKKNWSNFCQIAAEFSLGIEILGLEGERSNENGRFSLDTKAST
jgi:hypothetical protein